MMPRSPFGDGPRFDDTIARRCSLSPNVHGTDDGTVLGRLRCRTGTPSQKLQTAVGLGTEVDHPAALQVAKLGQRTETFYLELM